MTILKVNLEGNDTGNRFPEDVADVLAEIGTLLIEKNAAYGDSALNPVRVFSRASTEEQLRVRIDDKLSRLARGHEYAGDDTETDLLGYLVMLKIAKNRAIENATGRKPSQMDRVAWNDPE